MGQFAKIYRVFIASPSDLADERKVLFDVVATINQIWSKETDWRIELLGWEESLPGARRAQEIINEEVDKADLFVGMVWQTMGSPASNSSGLTGFEEEFYRASKRRKESGGVEPEIWLFFKKIAKDRLSDPGPLLEKVIKFRDAQIDGKELMFKEFEDIMEWGRKIRDLLDRQMIRNTVRDLEISKGSIISGSEKVQNNPATAITESASQKPDQAVNDLATLLGQVSIKVENRELGNFGSKSPGAEIIARMLLFSECIYDYHSQRIELGSHEINSIYWQRKSFDIMRLETMFLVKNVMLDTSGTKPGWFWINKAFGKSPRWFDYTILYWGELGVREMAIWLAKENGLKIKAVGKGRRRPIQILLEDDAEVVKLAALGYLATRGSERDLKYIEAALEDSSKAVRNCAENTIRLIKFRLNPDQEFRAAIEQRTSIDEPVLEILRNDVRAIKEDTFIFALNHPDGAIRQFAAKILEERGGIDKRLATLLCEDTARSVKEIGFVVLANLGEKVELDCVKQLAGPPSYFAEPDWNKLNEERIDKAILNQLDDKALWQYMEEIDRRAISALEVLCQRGGLEISQRLRRHVIAKFEDVGAPVSPYEIFVQKSKPFSAFTALMGLDGIRRLLLEVAIKYLAQNATVEDRDLFLKNLDAEGDVDITSAALKGLAVVGTSADRSAVMPLLKSKKKQIELEAAITWLKLSPTRISGYVDLLANPSPAKFWVVIKTAVESKDRSLWRSIGEHLNHSEEEVRRMICFYLTRLFGRKRVESELSKYLDRETYFYNVVAILDRFVYAPPFLQRHFRKEEELFFSKWRC